MKYWQIKIYDVQFNTKSETRRRRRHPTFTRLKQEQLTRRITNVSRTYFDRRLSTRCGRTRSRKLIPWHGNFFRVSVDVPLINPPCNRSNSRNAGSMRQELTMLGASIDRDRSAWSRTAAFKRRCRRIDLFVKRPSVNVQWVRKNGHRPERGEWIFGTTSRVPRSGTFSLLLALSFNLVAHLHRCVLTRRTLQQAFPRAFHQPARKFRATLIYLGRDRLHDTYFFFLSLFSVPFLRS